MVPIVWAVSLLRSFKGSSFQFLLHYQISPVSLTAFCNKSKEHWNCSLGFPELLISMIKQQLWFCSLFCNWFSHDFGQNTYLSEHCFLLTLSTRVDPKDARHTFTPKEEKNYLGQRRGTQLWITGHDLERENVTFARSFDL